MPSGDEVTGLHAFDELDPKLVKDLCKILYQAFAVGAEHSGVVCRS